MGATGWSFRSMTIDLPALESPGTLGVVPFFANAALPDKETTTASSGWAVGWPVSSQTVTRSLSIEGLGAVCAVAWNSNAQRNRIRVIVVPFGKRIHVQDIPNGYDCGVPPRERNHGIHCLSSQGLRIRLRCGFSGFSGLRYRW